MIEPVEWARRVFGVFAKTYTANLGGDTWTLAFDEESSSKLGLTRQQAAAGLQLLKDQGLIQLMTPRQFRLTPRGMKTCAAVASHPLGVGVQRQCSAISLTINAHTIQNAQIGNDNVMLKERP